MTVQAEFSDGQAQQQTNWQLSERVTFRIPWGVRGMYEAPAIEHKACPPTMGGEPPRAIKHPAVIGPDSLRAPVTVAREILGCQRVRNYIGRDVDVR